MRGDHGETYLTWNASGVPIKQIVQLDKSYGADGIAVRGGINKVADLKGKTISVDAPGTSSIFCWPGSSIKTA